MRLLLGEEDVNEATTSAFYGLLETLEHCSNCGSSAGGCKRRARARMNTLLGGPPRKPEGPGQRRVRKPLFGSLLFDVNSCLRCAKQRVERTLFVGRQADCETGDGGGRPAARRMGTLRPFAGRLMTPYAWLVSTLASLAPLWVKQGRGGPIP